MVDRDDFNLEDSGRREPYPRKKQQDWSSTEAEEPNEFARRLEGEKRESAKREREMQKIVRQDQEGELSQRSPNRDRRAQEKDIKRRYNELKRVADTLGIKQALQRVSSTASFTCWGPDVASDKKRPCVGVFLNYTPGPLAGGNIAEQTLSLFGAWLYLPNPADEQIHIVVGSKRLALDSEQWERARAPERAACVLTTHYQPSNHDDIQAQIEQALLNWRPSN
jgi:hypothetical protein